MRVWINEEKAELISPWLFGYDLLINEYYGMAVGILCGVDEHYVENMEINGRWPISTTKWVELNDLSELPGYKNISSLLIPLVEEKCGAVYFDRTWVKCSVITAALVRRILKMTNREGYSFGCVFGLSQLVEMLESPKMWQMIDQTGYAKYHDACRIARYLGTVIAVEDPKEVGERERKEEEERKLFEQLKNKYGEQQ